VLNDREIHVWNAHLDPPNARSEQLNRVLSEDERERAERFHFDKDRARFVYARSVLRVLLGRYLNVPPADVTFRYGRTGKPELSPAFHETNLQFNLSHSHGQLLFAVARHCAVGVDIEMIRPETDIERIAERFFSFAETEQLRAVNGLGKRTAFFNGWTRKEAYLKARGEGIGEGLDQFAVSLIPGKPAQLLFDWRDPDAVSRWSIFDLATPSGFSAALVVEGADLTLKRFAWDTFASHTLGMGTR
jgi:4'-phosphopantetheinyl transferase